MSISRTTRTRITLHLRTTEARAILKVLEEFALNPDRELDCVEWDAINESLRYIQENVDEANRLDRDYRRQMRETKGT